MGNGISGGSSEDGKFIGLENFGNTCYCNAILQALYFCEPFRRGLVSHYHLKNGSRGQTLLDCLAELFEKISLQKKSTGVITPKGFVAKLQSDSEMFRGPMHQDAHEFLNYMINAMCDAVEADMKKGFPATPGPFKTWVHAIFEGILTNNTKCLNCKTVSTREETFLDLSLEIEANTSLTYCLKQFGNVEFMNGDDKFFCDKCHSLQDAEKRTSIKQTPLIEDTQSFAKLFHRVLFTTNLKLPDTITEKPCERRYELFSVIIHIGNGMNEGHYVSLIRWKTQWYLFDDDTVTSVDEQMLETCYGSGNPSSNNAAGYILFYKLAH